MLLMYAGKDATKAFSAVHTHTSYAKEMLQQYHIGYLPDVYHSLIYYHSLLHNSAHICMV
jgi:cytochrome b involved in lipid metabolism